MATIVAICGSLRAGSSNHVLLGMAQELAPVATEIILYDGVGGLPHFNPDLDAEGATPPVAVAELRALLSRADGVLVSSPEYAHGVPGSLKNALDWVVSTTVLSHKPIGLIMATPSGGQYAKASLTETLNTMDGRVIDEATTVVLRAKAPETREEIRRVVAALVSAILG